MHAHSIFHITLPFLSEFLLLTTIPSLTVALPSPSPPDSPAITDLLLRSRGYSPICYTHDDHIASQPLTYPISHDCTTAGFEILRLCRSSSSLIPITFTSDASHPSAPNTHFLPLTFVSGTCTIELELQPGAPGGSDRASWEIVAASAAETIHECVDRGTWLGGRVAVLGARTRWLKVSVYRVIVEAGEGRERDPPEMPEGICDAFLSQLGVSVS